MINVRNRISLSHRSKVLVRKFWKKKKGILDAKSWGQISSSVKNEISEKLLINQDFKCVYCERQLIGLSHQIDHFAHKASYSRFSFNPTNLFYACGFCNSAAIKGAKNTIRSFNDRYDMVRFNIVHPLRDDPDNEIRYRDADRVDLEISGCTYLGKRTIVFFKMHGKTMTNIRSRQLVFERMNPLRPDQEAELIKEAIAYK